MSDLTPADRMLANDLSLDLSLATATLLDLRRHLTIVHHVRGRIRFRLGVALWQAAAATDRQLLNALLNQLQGIRDMRVNPAVASVVVEYDPQQIAAGDWEILLSGDRATASELLSQWLAHCRQSMDSTQPNH
jgi:hypothetical protein